jgi:hypothetical protein
MFYKILADSIVVIHFLWIVFLFFGVFWGVRNEVVRIFHISGFAFAFVIQIFGWYCPLTYLEVWLRSRHDSVLTYSGSFIIHYVEELVYIEVSRTLIFFLTLLICGLNVWLYLKKGKKPKPSN